jgi:hypothetical protein
MRAAVTVLPNTVRGTRGHAVGELTDVPPVDGETVTGDLVADAGRLARGALPAEQPAMTTTASASTTVSAVRAGGTAPPGSRMATV